MSERELPRPATPGPWPADFVYEAVRHIERNCDFIESQTNPDFWWDRYKDAPAIAALPEWIEDRDRWKARALEAERVVAAAKRWADAISTDHKAADALVFAILSYEDMT